MKDIKNLIIPKLKPYGVTGYFDGEGCFNILIYKNTKMKVGYSLTFSVEIKQHKLSDNILFSLKDYFGNKGSITSYKNISRYKISSISDIIHYVIPHFDKYPLLSSKQLNYLDFKKAINIISKLGHFNLEGINKIKNITSKMNTNREFLDKWNYCKNLANMKESLHPE